MQIISNDIDFLEFAGLTESQHLSPTVDYADEVKARFTHGVQVLGEPLPWAKTFDLIGFRLGEVSIWNGYNGHGKSLVLGQTLMYFPQHIKILIASLEMKPAATLQRMVRQASGVRVPSNNYIDQFMKATDNIYIYDQTDTVQPNKILGLIHYCARHLNIQHFMIDSLVKCGVSTDDYAGQARFVDRLCWAAKSENIHIHLVHHVRKGADEDEIPGKMDSKGAGEITDLVDNLIVVHRTKKKERLMEKLKREGREPTEEETLIPDETLNVRKQRHGEWEGQIALYFDKESTQYKSGPDARCIPWRV